MERFLFVDDGLAEEHFRSATPLHKVMKYFFALLIALTLSATTHIAYAEDTNKPPGAESAKKAQLVEPAEAQKMIAEKKVIVLDVRSPSEFVSGHIGGATNIDINGKDFKEHLEQLDKSQPYLVHCAVGMRSARACTTMSSMGFTNLYDLKGGLNSWKKAGEPLVK